MQRLEELQIDIPGVRSKPVDRMSGGQRQLVAIARGAFWGSKLLAARRADGGARRPRVARGSRPDHAGSASEGLTIVMVTHNLEHLWLVCNRVVVMRRGRKAADMMSAATTDRGGRRATSPAPRNSPSRSGGAMSTLSKTCRLLAGAPNRWGRWGADDEIGALNFLDAPRGPARRGRGKQGRTFTLGVPIATDAGDPVFPGRWPARHYMVADKAGFTDGHWHSLPGGLEFADDYRQRLCAGRERTAMRSDTCGSTTRCGMAFRRARTNGGMTKAGIDADSRERGDRRARHPARYRAASRQGGARSRRDVRSSRLRGMRSRAGREIGPRSILLIRTGWVGALFDGRQTVGRRLLGAGADLHARSGALVRPNGNSLPCHRYAGQRDDLSSRVPACMLVLHAALMRNLGVVFTEMASLDALAADCAADGVYEGLYCAAPTKVTKGTGGSANPVFIK